MASRRARKVGSTAEKNFTAPQQLPTDSGTVAIMAVESLETSTGVNMDTLKTVGLYLNKVRDRLVIADTEKSATPMVEIGEALDAFKAHATTLKSKRKASRMEERMLALEKAVTKNLEEPLCKMAASAVQGMGVRPIYASIVAPPATKAAVRIKIQGADNMQLAELIVKAKLHFEGAFAVWKLRNNEAKLFMQLVSQRDTALSMAQSREFCVLKQDYPVEI